MKIIGFFTDRPITTLMTYAILALMGVVAFLKMPVDLMPGGDTGVLTIFVGIRGGLPPEDIESLVTKPIEDEMAALPNLEDIVSVSRKERATISLTFKVGTDSSRVALEVQERLAKIRGKLPKEIEKPVVSRYDESQAPILILAMSSKHFTPEQMRDISDNQLKPILKRIEGVANVEVGGGRERKILVEFDQDRLGAYAIPIRQVIGQIGSDNLNILTGKIEKEKDAYLVRTVGAFKTLDDLGNLPVAVTKEGSRIRLKDIAEIKDFYMEQESYSRLNREPVVSSYIQKESLSNTIATAKKVKKAMEEFKKNLDPRINFSIVSDQSIAIEKALKNVRKCLIEGAFLAGIVLIIFLQDLLASSIIFISIPLSFIITLAIMHLFNLNLNVMTISGLALASGMVVDDSIVVLENITHHRIKLLRAMNRQKVEPSRSLEKEQKGKQNGMIDDLGEGQSGEKSADVSLPVKATNEMLLALVSSTLTKCIVFLPVVFLNPQVRMLYLGLSITVTSALLISLMVAVTVIPSLAANVSPKWMKESSFFSTFLRIYVQNKLTHGMSRFDPWISKVRKWFRKRFKKKNVDEDMVYSTTDRLRLFQWQHGFRKYRHFVALVMRKRYWIALSLVLVLLGCGFLYKHLDKEFVGVTEEDEFIIFVELPSGAKLDLSDKVVSSVEKLLNEIPEVKKAVKTSVARVEGWSSKIYVTLLPKTERIRSVQEIIDSLRPLITPIGQEYSAFIYFSEPISSKEFVIDVFGYDYSQLRDVAVRIAQSLEKVHGFVDIKLRYKPGRPEVRVEIDREKSSLFGVTVQDIAESLHAQIRGLRATYFMTPTAQIETVARLQEQYRKTLSDVQLLSLVNPHGIVVPVRQFANFEFGLTPSEIWRKDRERMIQVSANRGDIALSKAGEESMKALRGLQVPTGYYYEFGGDFPKMIETEKESRYAFIMMILLVYTVLASLFESYSQPLVILIAVPLTLIGSIPLLYITKTPVTLGALIGLIMLGGISVSNSIILVDVFNSIRKSKGKLRSLLQAGQERIRPILMTTLTTILGLVPLLLGKEESGSLWAPLATSVIGGLTVSTVLVLFVLPGFYLILEDIQAMLKKYFSITSFKLFHKKATL